MADAPFLGTGYTMLPIRAVVEDGLLPKFPNVALAVYVTIAAHADRESGLAHPGFLRIAIYSGVSKSSVVAAIKWLEESKWIEVDRSGRFFIYRLLALDHQFDPMIAVPLRQRVVFSGLWAECPPSAKRAFIVLLSRSRMGRPDEFEGVVSNMDEVCEEIRGDGGYRHVPVVRSDPKDLARLMGLPDRTYRFASKVLDKLGLTETDEGSGEYLLPNTPLYHSDRVHESLRAAVDKDQARSASRGALISAGRRRKRKTGNAEPESRQPDNSNRQWEFWDSATAGPEIFF